MSCRQHRDHSKAQAVSSFWSWCGPWRSSLSAFCVDAALSIATELVPSSVFLGPVRSRFTKVYAISRIHRRSGSRAVVLHREVVVVSKRLPIVRCGRRTSVMLYASFPSQFQFKDAGGAENYVFGPNGRIGVCILTSFCTLLPSRHPCTLSLLITPLL
jgi:hypothetical protein